MNWPNNVSAAQNVHALIRGVSKAFVCSFHSLNPPNVCQDCGAQQSITFSRKIKECVPAAGCKQRPKHAVFWRSVESKLKWSVSGGGATDGELLHPAKYMCNHCRSERQKSGRSFARPACACGIHLTRSAAAAAGTAALLHGDTDFESRGALAAACTAHRRDELETYLCWHKHSPKDLNKAADLTLLMKLLFKLTTRVSPPVPGFSVSPHVKPFFSKLKLISAFLTFKLSLYTVIVVMGHGCNAYVCDTYLWWLGFGFVYLINNILFKIGFCVFSHLFCSIDLRVQTEGGGLITFKILWEHPDKLVQDQVSPAQQASAVREWKAWAVYSHFWASVRCEKSLTRWEIHFQQRMDKAAEEV